MTRDAWMFWGQVLQIVGACYLAAHEPTSWVAYYVMFIGSVLLLCVAREARPVWVTFTFINLLGIWRWTPWGIF